MSPSERVAGGGQQFVQQQRSPERDNQIFSKTLQFQEPKPLAVPNEGQANSVPVRVGSGDSCKGWKPVTSGTRREALDPPAGLQLLKRFSALIASKGLGTVSNETSELAESERCSSNQEEVASDSSG